MRILKVLAIAALTFSLSSSPVFAAPEVNVKPGQVQTDTQKKDHKDFGKKKVEFDGQQDPIKALEKKKERVQRLLKEGKLEKEKAEEITAKIDARINKIREFNSLSVEQKKATLLKDYKAHIDQKVKESRLTQEKADELVKAFTEKVNQWDGKGYPDFMKRGHYGKHKYKKGTE